MTSATYWIGKPAGVVSLDPAVLAIHQFWTDEARSRWPDDRCGYIFLGRAVQTVGRAMFGSDWAGSEFSTPQPLTPDAIPSDLSKLSTSQILHMLISKHRPEVELPAYASLTGGRPAIPSSLSSRTSGSPALPANLLTREHREIAVEIAREQEAQVAPLLERRFAVEKEIARRCADAQLVSCYRSQGDYVLIPFQHWNFEGWGYRFERCEYEPMRPWFRPMAGKGCYIFLTEVSLRAIFGERKAPAEPEPWAPEPLVHAKQWAPRPEVIAAAKARLRTDGATNPSKKVIAQEQEAMWGEYRDDKVTWRTFETYLGGVEV